MPATPELMSTRALQYAFAAHLRNPKQVPVPAGIEPRRMAIYSDLFFNNIEGLLAGNFPVIRTLYETTQWRHLVRDFYRDHKSHTPLFTEIGREFIRYLEIRAERGAGDPPFLLELAHYEWSELALSLDEHEIGNVEHNSGGNVITGVPVVSPLTRLLAYHFPVHRISTKFRPDAPSATLHLILIIRNREDAIRFLEVEPLTALLFERLSANTTQPGVACLNQTLAELGQSDNASLQESGQTMLIKLKQCDAILGTLG